MNTNGYAYYGCLLAQYELVTVTCHGRHENTTEVGRTLLSMSPMNSAPLDSESCDDDLEEAITLKARTD